MRGPGPWSSLLAASFTSGLALGAEPAPPAPPAPPSEPAPLSAEATAVTPSAPPAAADTPATPATAGTAPAQARAEETKPVGVSSAPSKPEPATDFKRDFSALPLSLEARFGFNARLGSSFADSADEEHWGASYAFASYLAWRREFALGLELDHIGLGQVRALSGQASVDNEYSATAAWLAARVFPIRRERFDLFVNLRVGMVFQHVDALGTRGNDMSITEPAQSYACAEWDGPGIGLGGAVGLAYRLSRRFAFVSRLDLTGQKLSGQTLGTCAEGIGSVATLGGSVGLSFELETAPK